MKVNLLYREDQDAAIRAQMVERPSGKWVGVPVPSRVFHPHLLYITVLCL